MQLWKKSEVFLEWLYKALFHWTEFTAIREAESVIFRTGNVIKVLDKNYERAHSFQNSLRNAVKPYHVLAQQEKSKKQQDISKFFTKKVSEKQATDINSSKIASLFAKQTTKNKVAEKKIELNKSLVVDIEESSHDLAVVICHKCEKLATHFCRSCDQNLCKFCIIDHYKNKNFIKDHEMIPL